VLLDTQASRWRGDVGDTLSVTFVTPVILPVVRTHLIDGLRLRASIGSRGGTARVGLLDPETRRP